MVPQNRFGDLVEAALRVEKSTTTMYQSRQERKRSASGSSQQSSGQSSKKRSKGTGYRCHTPNPGPTQSADSNRFLGRKTITGTLYLIFFKAELAPVGMAHIL